MKVLQKIISLVAFFILLLGLSYFIRSEREYLNDFVMKYSEDTEIEMLNCSCQMKGKKKHGRNQCFDDKGILFLEEHFSNDKRNGSHTVYYPSGSTKEVRNYLKDSLDGKSVEYFPNGIKQFIRYYRNGEYVYEKEFDKLGELLVSGIKVNIDKVEDSDFRVGIKSKIKFQLDYSEFDTLFLVGLFDLNNDNLYEDTIFSKQDYLIYEVEPEKSGSFELNGLIMEIDGHEMIESGEGAFNYEYLVQ